jgi:hypothetical protein
MVKINLRDLSPNLQRKLSYNVDGNIISYKSFGEVNEMLAPYHGFLSSDYSNSVFYVLSFESEKYMTRFFLEYG